MNNKKTSMNRDKIHTEIIFGYLADCPSSQYESLANEFARGSIKKEEFDEWCEDNHDELYETDAAILRFATDRETLDVHRDCVYGTFRDPELIQNIFAFCARSARITGPIITLDKIDYVFYFGDGRIRYGPKSLSTIEMMHFIAPEMMSFVQTQYAVEIEILSSIHRRLCIETAKKDKTNRDNYIGWVIFTKSW